MGIPHVWGMPSGPGQAQEGDVCIAAHRMGGAEGGEECSSRQGNRLCRGPGAPDCGPTGTLRFVLRAGLAVQRGPDRRQVLSSGGKVILFH